MGIPVKCSTQDCPWPVRARGMCSGCWGRWRKTVDEPEVNHGPKTLQEAFDRMLKKYPPVTQSGGCIVWTGPATPDGYGMFCFRKRRCYAHVEAYRLISGAIPDKYEVDHKCLNTSCINTDHLRTVTHKQNTEHRNGAYSNSLTGVRGITYDTKRKQYRARVKHNYKEVHVGRFATLEEAESAVIAKRLELFTHNDLDRNVA